MRITFEIKYEDDGYHEDEYDTLHFEDRLELIKTAISDGFMVPEESIRVLNVEK